MKRTLLISLGALLLTIGSRAPARALEVPLIFTVSADAIADSLSAMRSAPGTVVIGLLPVWRQPFNLQFPSDASIRSYTIDPYYPYTTPADQVQRPWLRTGVRAGRVR
jgi:hypothetical protein